MSSHLSRNWAHMERRRHSRGEQTAFATLLIVPNATLFMAAKSDERSHTTRFQFAGLRHLSPPRRPASSPVLTVLCSKPYLFGRRTVILWPTCGLACQ